MLSTQRDLEYFINTPLPNWIDAHEFDNVAVWTVAKCGEADEVTGVYKHNVAMKVPYDDSRDVIVWAINELVLDKKKTWLEIDGRFIDYKPDENRDLPSLKKEQESLLKLDPKDAAYVEALSNQFHSNTKCTNYIVTPGAKVKGNIEKGLVQSFAISVTPKNQSTTSSTSTRTNINNITLPTSTFSTSTTSSQNPSGFFANTINSHVGITVPRGSVFNDNGRSTTVIGETFNVDYNDGAPTCRQS